MSKSIYQLICDNMNDGLLAKDFTLHEKSSPAQFSWAPGAQDGVAIYHMGHPRLDSTATKRMVQALRAAAQQDFATADNLFAAWCEDYRAVSIVDDLQSYLIKHQNHLDPTNMYHAARWLMLSSSHTECVKVGMEIMELFEETSDENKEIIRRLGQYDEFTIFAVWNMQKWENGNEEIYKLAQKVHSWGRIHAVERLEPETEEIKDWLLIEGTKNEVVNAYSSLTCWQKSDAEQILFGNVSRVQFDALATLIAGLLDEGPVPGISQLEDPEGILKQFLKLAACFDLTWEDYDVIGDVKFWAENEDEADGATDIAIECDAFLSSEKCREVVHEASKSAKGLHLAAALNIPFHKDLYQFMKLNFSDSCYYCSYLMADSEYLEPTIELFHKHLPLSEMTGEPTDEYPSGDEFEKANQLIFLLQGLSDKPLVGNEFMMTALHSPYVMLRNRALQNLKNWVVRAGKPLEEFSPEFYIAVKVLDAKEINDGAKKSIAQLLSGKIQFDEPTFYEEEEIESEDE